MRKLIAALLAFLFAGLFLNKVLTPPSSFNFIPYLIHEAMSSGGEGESRFIVVFDVIFSIGLFFLFYWLFKTLLRNIINRK